MPLYRLTRSRIGIRVNRATVILSKDDIISMTAPQAAQFGDRLEQVGGTEKIDTDAIVDWIGLVEQTRRATDGSTVLPVQRRLGVPLTAEPPITTTPLSPEEQAIATWKERIATLNGEDTITMMLKIEDPDELIAFRAAEVGSRGRKTVLKAIDDRFEDDEK